MPQCTHTAQERSQQAAASRVCKVSLQCGLSLGLSEKAVATVFSVCNFLQVVPQQEEEQVKKKKEEEKKERKRTKKKRKRKKTASWVLVKRYRSKTKQTKATLLAGYTLMQPAKY